MNHQISDARIFTGAERIDTSQPRDGDDTGSDDHIVINETVLRALTDPSWDKDVDQAKLVLDQMEFRSAAPLGQRIATRIVESNAVLGLAIVATIGMMIFLLGSAFGAPFGPLTDTVAGLPSVMGD
ncbi:MAG: hypothetical protein ACU0CY_10850 [Maritimibacter harenae]